MNSISIYRKDGKFVGSVTEKMETVRAKLESANVTTLPIGFNSVVILPRGPIDGILRALLLQGLSFQQVKKEITK
jgi:hypothetical protein